MRYCSGVACWQEAHSRRCQNECQRESRSFHETLLNLDPNYGSGCCCDISKCSSRSAEGLAEWNNTSEAFFPPFLDTLLLCKYFDMRSLMDFAFISKHLRNVLACHMITFRELCLPPYPHSTPLPPPSGWLWTWESGLSCAASRHSHAWPRLRRSQLRRWKPRYCLAELSRVMGRLEATEEVVSFWKSLLLIFKRNPWVETAQVRSPVALLHCSIAPIIFVPLLSATTCFAWGSFKDSVKLLKKKKKNTHIVTSAECHWPFYVCVSS